MSCMITLKNPALMRFPHISCLIQVLKNETLNADVELKKFLCTCSHMYLLLSALMKTL